VEDAQRRITQAATEIEALEREAITGVDHSERIAELQAIKTAEETRLANLKAQWDKERELIGQIRDIHSQLEEARGKSVAAGSNGKGAAAPAASAAAAGAAQSPASDAATSPASSAAPAVEVEPKTDGHTVDVEGLRSKLSQLNEELEKIQGETPLMQACVDSQTIGDVISGWTGIPVGKMLTDEIQTVMKLKDRLEERVIGQSHGLEAIAQRIRTARAQLTDPRRPVGVFLLVGPSGVGKTETALSLADTLYGGEKNLVTINMSEYQEAHTVSSLKGSPPGYVGYGEGGVLTEAVRRKPYSVVLLDEVEKAHPDVM
jgi:type VI secretion system protein VasG